MHNKTYIKYVIYLTLANAFFSPVVPEQKDRIIREVAAIC